MAGFPKIRKTAFPGEAGRFQRAGDLAALVQELGGNYAKYHDFLAGALVEYGGRPTKERHGDRDAYVEAWARVQDLVRAEIILRSCFDHVTSGRPLDQVPDPRHGVVVTPDDRIARSQYAA